MKENVRGDEKEGGAERKTIKGGSEEEGGRRKEIINRGGKNRRNRMEGRI